MTAAQESRIRRAFTSRSLTEEDRDACDGLAYAFRSLALRVAEVCPGCRESAKALTCLEEAHDWARKAVVRYPHQEEGA